MTNMRQSITKSKKGDKGYSGTDKKSKGMDRYQESSEIPCSVTMRYKNSSDLNIGMLM